MSVWPNVVNAMGKSVAAQKTLSKQSYARDWNNNRPSRPIIRLCEYKYMEAIRLALLWWSSSYVPFLVHILSLAVAHEIPQLNKQNRRKCSSTF